MKTFTLALDGAKIKIPGIEIKIDGFEEYGFIFHGNINEFNKKGG